MKLRKVLSSVIAGALAVSAMAISVSAEADVIDFEDGAFTGISMKTDDGGDKSVLSVVDYKGSKQLKIEIQDKSKAPKIYFDLDEIYGSNLAKVEKITFDFTIQSKEGEEDIGFDAPGWGGGAIGVQASGAGVAWNQQDWTLEEYDADSASTKLERTNFGITGECDDAHMLVMRWASQINYDLYIDNVAAFDADGNVVPAYGAAEATSDEAADDEAEADDTADDEAEADDEAVADDEADADEDTDADDDADEDTDADEDDADEDDADEDDADADDDDDEDEAPAVTTAAVTAPVEEVTTTAAATAPAAGDVAAATDSSKGSPDTGVADVAAIAGLAIVAGGAVLVAKKRK